MKRSFKEKQEQRNKYYQDIWKAKVKLRYENVYHPELLKTPYKPLDKKNPH